MANAATPAPLTDTTIPQPGQAAAPWSTAHRIFFRFVCAYLALYTLPPLINQIPFAFYITGKYYALWQTICPWVARRFFHITGPAATYFPTGSGDTTLQYIQHMMYILVAIAAALTWTILDRKRPDYRALNAWLRVVVRFNLAFILFSYGFVKVFPLQFRTPGLVRLIEPYGEFSPMGALWWFMGASTPYIIFSGAAEVTGGLLLLFRRTSMLGGLVSFAVMLNVVLLNYCYDVPVKLYSTNILLMAVYVAAPDLRRLIDIFVLNRAAAPADLAQPRFERRWLRIVVTVVWIALVGWVLYGDLSRGWQGYQASRLHPPRPPIYGLYEVETFTRDGQDLPPVTTDSTRWRKFIADTPVNVTISMMDDKLANYKSAYDGSKNTLTLSPITPCDFPSGAPLSREARGCPADEARKSTLTYSRPDPGHLTLKGTFEGAPLSVQLRRIDESKFLLLSRGFHWINELPLNR